MTIVKFRKPFLYVLNPLPDYGGVWKVRVSIPSYSQPSIFDTDDFDFSDVNQSEVEIGNVYIDGIKYENSETLAECRGDQGSWYYDDTNYILYIHPTNGKRLDSSDFNSQEILGYSSSRVFYDENNTAYKPLISGDVEIEEEEDRLVYNKMTFSENSISLDNRGGAFDDYVDEPINGADIEFYYISYKDVVKGKTSLTPIYVGAVIEDNPGRSAFSLTLTDKRATLTNSWPENTFDEDTYPDMEDDYIDSVIPDGYGPVVGAPGICTNGAIVGASMTTSETLTGDDPGYDFSDVDDDSSVSLYVQLDDDDATSYSVDLSDVSDISTVTGYELYNAINDVASDELTASWSSTGALTLVYAGDESPDLVYVYGDAVQKAGIGIDVEFKVGELATAISACYLYIDDEWTEVDTPTIASDGTFTLDVTIARDSSGDYYDCKCDVTLRETMTGPDTAIDLMDRIAEVDYDNDNWDTTQVEEEIANYFTGNTSGVALYADEQEELYEYIQDLQGGDVRGWRLFVNPDGLYSIKVDDIDRDISAVYQAEENIDNDLTSTRDLEDYATSVVVNYAYDYTDDTNSSVTDDTRETDVFNTYRVYNEEEFDSLLTTEADAEYKADYIARDYSLARMNLSFTIRGVTPIEIYDVITFDTAIVRKGVRIREYAGVRKLKVSGVSYNFNQVTTTITGIDITTEVE